jgi:type IV secretory pathway TrbF-like protein
MTEPQARIEPPTVAPYPRPRLTRGDRLRSPFVSANLWRLVAVLALVGFVSATGMAFYLALRNTSRLAVITVDAQNHVLAVGAPDIPEDRQVLAIKRDLTQVVEWIRTVPGDADLLKANWTKALMFMDPNGMEMLKSFGREMRPDQVARDWRIRVEVQDIQPVTPGSYLVEWVEKFYKLPEASLKQTKRYRSVLSFRIEPPTQETAEAKVNWLGLRIYDAHWHPQPDFTIKPGTKPPVQVLKGGP